MRDWEHVGTTTNNERVTRDHVLPAETVTVAYRIQGWLVRLTASPGRPFEGFERMEISIVDEDGADDAIQSDGLTTEVLRAIPLADARRRLLEASSPAQMTDADASAIRGVVRSQGDLARFASAIGRVAESSRRPIEVIHEQTGASRNTLNARVRRARKAGFLDGFALTAAAEACLASESDEQVAEASLEVLQSLVRKTEAENQEGN